MPKIILILYLVSLSSILVAQRDASGFFMQNTYQQTHYNPAFADNRKVSIAIGNFSGALFATGENILSDGVVDGTGDLVIPADQLNRSSFDVGAMANLGSLEVGLRLGDMWSINVGHHIQSIGITHISEDLLNLAVDGNAPYIGQKLELSPRADFMAYQEIYAGVGYHTDKLSVGARLGFVNGLQSLETERDQIDITTNEEFYQLDIETDYLINTVAGVDYNGLDDIDANIEQASFGQNTGLSIDLGAAYRVSDKLEFSASLLDIGSITWSEGAQQFSSQGTFSYEGVDINDYIDEDIEIDFSDSLSNLLQIEETNTTYTTVLPSQLTLGGMYHISEDWRVGAVVFHRFAPGQAMSTAAVNTTKSFFGVLDLGTTLSYRRGSPFNIGVNVGVNLGPVQLLLASDNILGADVQRSTHAHLRFGLGVRFGKLSKDVSTKE